jgi:hypothetical protein
MLTDNIQLFDLKHLRKETFFYVGLGYNSLYKI